MKGGLAARKGKIARLPSAIRHQLNLRLQNGEKTVPLADWLNQLPEVKTVIDAEFDGVPVSKSNISQWRQGGYRDWEAMQPAINAVQSLIEQSDALKENFPDSLVERMNLVFTGRMIEELIRAGAAGNKAKQAQELGEWLIRFGRMRRAEFNGQRLAIERERLELLRKRTKGEFEEQCWKWAAQEHIRAQIALGYCFTQDEIRRESGRILGIKRTDGKSSPGTCGEQVGPQPS